jgi:hypothetical protein
MDARQCRKRRWGYWMALVAFGGACVSLTSVAQAQNGRIGTVLGVPFNKLEAFRLANETTGTDGFGHPIPPNDVAVLHLSTDAGSPINSAVATVSITQKGSGLKVSQVFFPPEADGGISPLYQFINAKDSFTNPRILSNGVVQMDVRQTSPGTFLVEDVRFMLIPLDSISQLDTENRAAINRLVNAGRTPRLESVHAQQMANSFGSFWVHLIAVDEELASELKIPGGLTSTVKALNSNISVGPGNLAQVR